MNNEEKEIVNEEINNFDSIEEVELENVETNEQQIVEEVQESSNQLPQKRKSNKALVIVLIIIIMALLGTCGYFVWDKYFKNNDKSNSNNETPTPSITSEVTPSTISNDGSDQEDNNKEISELPSTDIKYYLYYDNEYGSYWKEEASQYINYSQVYACKTASYNDCKIYLYNNNKNIAVVYDNGFYYLYNFDNNTYKKLNINVNPNDIYSVRGIIKNNELIGFSIGIKSPNVRFVYYDLSSNKFVTNLSKYDQDFYVNEYDNYIYTSVQNSVIVIDLSNFQEIETIENGKNLIYDENINCYILKSGNFNRDYGIDVLNNKFKSILNNENNVQFLISTNTNGTFTIVYGTYYDQSTQKYVYDTQYYVYNKDGNLLSKSKEYKNVYKPVKDFVIINDNNNLKLIDIINNKEIILSEITDDISIEPSMTAYYTHKENPGIYVIAYDNSKEAGQQGYGIEYYYIPATGEIGKLENNGDMGRAKPVLYLYPEEETKVTVSFEKPELLTTTYPKYKNNWIVTVKPNGDLYDANGKYYYGLYWEEKGSTKVDFSEGYYVTKETALEFLEEKCEEIGLTRREANEFIMYWLPILEKNEKNLVYFELTNSLEKYNKLNISPKPDSLLRMAIHVKKVDTEINIKPQTIAKFERNGFTAVEWGGVIH